MKQSNIISFAVCTVLNLTSCYSNSNDNAIAENNDAIEVAEVTDETVTKPTRPNAPKEYGEIDGDIITEVQSLYNFYEWFDEFQERYPHWTESTDAHKKLISEFKSKMKSDLEFAKDFQYGDVVDSDCISRYDRADGEYGGIWSHVIKIKVKLLNPLYNGQDEVELVCEIISTIPATENHYSPYTENANYVDTFKQYHDMDYDGTLNLGTFIVTKKV